jgi:7-cyano-7-deazaguanine synthase in queuosine biosynthesis
MNQDCPGKRDVDGSFREFLAGIVDEKKRRMLMGFFENIENIVKASCEESEKLMADVESKSYEELRKSYIQCMGRRQSTISPMIEKIVRPLAKSSDKEIALTAEYFEKYLEGAAKCYQIAGEKICAQMKKIKGSDYSCPRGQ